MNQTTDNLHPMAGPEAGLPFAPAALGVPVESESGGDSWQPLTGQPVASWKEALRQVEKRIARETPQAARKFSLWFAPMPLASIQQRGSEIQMRFVCTNQKRKQEVRTLQPMLEDLLAAELFPNKRVVIELIEPVEQTSGGVPARVLIPTQPAQPACEHNSADQAAPPAAEPLPSPVSPPAVSDHLPHSDAAEASRLEFFRQKVDGAGGSTNSDSISDADLQAVLEALKSQKPEALAALEREHRRQTGVAPARPDAESQPPTRPGLNIPPPARLDEILLEPSYASTYDEIVRENSAVYLPAYFARHLRHMGAADGLRFLALRQIAYKQGLHDANGAHLLPATVKELSRWSTLQPRRIYGGLDDPNSYLFLLAGKVPFLDYYAARPAASRWEDASGFHWKTGGREYCLWKRDGQPTNECSQLMPDRFSGEMQWRQAPLIYRVQLSMPLCPEDETALRAALCAFGVREDPLGAIRQCLALPRAELIPDRPARIDPLPRKLYSVQELVLESWGRLDERELAAKVAVQAKLLETHLIQERDLLKIPFYLLEKWGPYLSPAQLWTAILAMDHVYAGRKDGQYRDTAVIRNGIKEMTLWTEDQYSKGAARKITKWLYPFNITSGGPDEKDAGGTGEHFNPWFSVFVSEILPENGARVKNADNSVQTKLRVLPLVPLCPEDTLRFARKMGLDRLAIRDASGQALALEITEEELAVYLPDGRTLRYAHTGELRYGQPATVTLRAHDRQLNGIELLTSDHFYESSQWPGDLFGRLENQAGAFSGNLESGSSALSDRQEKTAGALFGELTLDAGALFGMLLKLLILNLYGIKNNANLEKPPSVNIQPENVDSLEQFGTRQGQFIQWTGVNSENDWDFANLVKSFGISDVKSLINNAVTAGGLVSTILELYATPADKFTTSRIAVLVARLRANPRPEPGIYLRLAEFGPEALQDYLRRAILNVSPLLNDPDWDQALGRARRTDLIELAEKLGLARVFRAVSDG